MQIRLTKEGQQALGFSPDRIIASVSDNRAFVMMSNGMAISDKGFMALFDGEVPALDEVEKSKPKLTNAEKQQKRIDEIMKPKKEKAVSKKAANRKKAVKK